jgi:hypothetical protein
LLKTLQQESLQPMANNKLAENQARLLPSISLSKL